MIVTPSSWSQTETSLCRKRRHLDPVPLQNRLVLRLPRQTVREENLVPQVCRRAALQLTAVQDLPQRLAQRSVRNAALPVRCSFDLSADWSVSLVQVNSTTSETRLASVRTTVSSSTRSWTDGRADSCRPTSCRPEPVS